MLNKSILKQFLFILLALICASPTFAHDVGMSSLNVELVDKNLTIRTNYSMREIEKIISLTDEKQLAELAKDEIILSVDGKEIAPNESNFLFSEGDGIVFSRTFHGINGESFQFKSSLISKLNPNHKQFFYVHRADQTTTVKEVLTSANDLITVDFEKLELNTSFFRFLPLGVEHIIFGFDHLLFLFALLLTVKDFGEIVKIITSFTVAHSITLSLATLDVIQISRAIIEPLIAISIIFIGLENLLKTEQKNRWLVTYIFGLIHGFGFASALQEIGIGKGFDVIEPLLSFNLGVEIGQIAIVLLVLPLLWKLQKLRFFANYFVPFGSGIVVLAGIYWFIERTFF